MWILQKLLARCAGSRMSSFDDILHRKVARALAVETDEAWARQLSLARGKNLAIIYAKWYTERSHLFER